MTVQAVGGRYAAVNGNTAIRNWQINDEQSPALFVNSATAIGHGRRPGIYAWSGSMSGHGGQPDVMPGKFFNFSGYTAPANGTLGTSGKNYTGNAIVDAVSITWDWASGAVLANTIQFSGSGALTIGNGTITDASVSDPEPIGPCAIQYGGVPLANITQATLNITCANQPYVNSSTASNTGRRAGIIDWSASINIEDDTLYSGLTKGTDYIWKFFTTADAFYQLKWGMVINATNLNVNPETGAIISYTMNIGMDGAEPGGAIGNILLPDTTTFWGT